MEKRKQLADHLTKAHLGVVTTVSSKGEPQGATVDFLTAMDGDDLILYFVTRRHSRKFDNLLHEARVGFVVGFGPEADTVQMQGVAHLLTEEAEITAYFAELEKYPALKELYFGKNEIEPWSELKGVGYEAVHIRVTWARWTHRNKEGKVITEMIIE